MQTQWDVIDVAAFVIDAIKDELITLEDGDFMLCIRFPLGVNPSHMDETIARVNRKSSDRQYLE
eukprot:6275167-Prorocentrum_lima.AAC.1